MFVAGLREDFVKAADVVDLFQAVQIVQRKAKLALAAHHISP